MDLAEGHVAALRYITRLATPPSLLKDSPVTAGSGAGGRGYGEYSVFNLGTGVGCSVLQMVEAMKRASGQPLPYEFGPRYASLA